MPAAEDKLFRVHQWVSTSEHLDSNISILTLSAWQGNDNALCERIWQLLEVVTVAGLTPCDGLSNIELYCVTN